MLRNMSPTVVSKLLPASPLLLALTALSGGCAYGEMTQVIRAQVATETDCTNVVVRRATSFTPGVQPGTSIYLVTGCDKLERFYTCKDDDGGLASYDTKCEFKQGAPSMPSGAAPSASPDAPPGEDAPPEDDLENG